MAWPIPANDAVGMITAPGRTCSVPGGRCAAARSRTCRTIEGGNDTDTVIEIGGGGTAGGPMLFKEARQTPASITTTP